jgi:2-polyprenyl-3-methyl-5-hydroxy-6-metoxy-1,4-benzoquinol methylase/3-polyprenyl-4-hydroxybenzoate decarboxylase
MSNDAWLDTRMRRAASARLVEIGGSLLVVEPDGTCHEMQAASAELARAVLKALRTPADGRTLLAALEGLSGGPLERPAVVGELLALLQRGGAIEPATAAPSSGPRAAQPGPRVVLGLTGAVATMHAPALVQRLQTRGFRVRVVATPGALRFVQATALESLTHEAVIAGMWPDDGGPRVPHIELAQWADCVLVCPASATTLARMASGSYDSIVAAVALATRAPVLVVPSMNEAMFTSPAVQRNLAQLVADGVHVAAPSLGIEVADRPTERTPALGAAPAASTVVPLLEAMLRRHRSQTGRTRAPDAEDWDAMYRDHLASELPWHSEEVDEALLATVAEIASAPASVLEIGTGLGVVAVQLAQRGYRVAATDVSGSALDAAVARAPGCAVTWLRDDITRTELRGRFQVMLDRGCLPTLGPADRRAYVTSATRLVEPGGALVLETLASETAAARDVTGFTRQTLVALFGAAWSLERETPTMIATAHGASLPGHRWILRRAT